MRLFPPFLEPKPGQDQEKDIHQREKVEFFVEVERDGDDI